MAGAILKQALLGLVGLTLLASRADAAEPPKIAVVATGGTIAMKLDPTTHAPVPALSGEDLVSGTGPLAGLVAQGRRDPG